MVCLRLAHGPDQYDWFTGRISNPGSRAESVPLAHGLSQYSWHTGRLSTPGTRADSVTLAHHLGMARVSTPGSWAGSLHHPGSGPQSRPLPDNALNRCGSTSVVTLWQACPGFVSADRPRLRQSARNSSPASGRGPHCTDLVPSARGARDARRTTAWAKRSATGPIADRLVPARLPARAEPRETACRGAFLSGRTRYRGRV